MKKRSLEQIRFSWSGHREALWWLRLFYRKPLHFQRALDLLQGAKPLATVAKLYLHALPYLLILAILLRLLVIGWLALQPEGLNRVSTDLLGHMKEAMLLFGLGQIFGLSGGLPLGARRAQDEGVSSGLCFGLALTLTFGSALGLVLGLAVVTDAAPFVGPVGGLIFGLLIGLVGGLTGGLVVGLARGLTAAFVGGAIAGSLLGLFIGLSGGLAIGIAFGIGFFLSLTRIYYLPLHWFLRSRPFSAAVYEGHPAAWDDLCGVGYRGLHRLLVDYYEEDEERGEEEIHRLLIEAPAQRFEAQHALTTVLLREAGEATNLMIGLVEMPRLPVGKKGFLRQTPRVNGWIDELIDRAQAVLEADNRLQLETLQSDLYRELDLIRDESAGLQEPLATELPRAVEKWRVLVAELGGLDLVGAES